MHDRYEEMDPKQMMFHKNVLNSGPAILWLFTDVLL